MRELTLSKIKNIKIENIDKVNLAIEFANEISKFYPCEPLFHIHESSPNYIDYITHILKNEKCKIKIKYLNFGNISKNEYMIYLDENFEYIDDYSKKRISENFPTPNKIHKLNEKSIKKWIDYWNNVYDYLYKLNLERKEKVNQFLDKIKNENIRWIDENRKGVIRKNGIEFFFEVNNDGSIYQKIGIALSEVLPNYDNFKLLSNNKFNNEKNNKYQVYDYNCNNHIDSNGYIGSGVSAYKLSDAIRIARKAKKYYGFEKMYVECIKDGELIKIYYV